MLLLNGINVKKTKSKRSKSYYFLEIYGKIHNIDWHKYHY